MSVATPLSSLQVERRDLDRGKAHGDKRSCRLLRRSSRPGTPFKSELCFMRGDASPPRMMLSASYSVVGLMSGGGP